MSETKRETKKTVTPNETKIIELAKLHFGELSEFEEKLFSAVAKGEFANFKSFLPPLLRKTADETEQSTPVLKSSIIKWLCTDPDACKLVHREGIQIMGAWFIGQLRLPDIRVDFPLNFLNCRFPDGLDISRSEIYGLYLIGTHLSELRGYGAEIKRDIVMREGFRCDGEVRLRNSTVGGCVICTGGTFLSENSTALTLNGAMIRGAVFLDSGFSAVGEVELSDAQIGSALECKNAEFRNEKGFAFAASRLRVNGSAFFNGAKLFGELNIRGAKIASNLELCGSSVFNKHKCAISADGIEIGNDLFIDCGFNAEGRVCFTGAKVNGSLILNRNTPSQYLIVEFLSADISSLMDDLESWPPNGNTQINGMVFKRIHDGSPTDSKRRIEWLRKQPTIPFRAQPYEQTAKVLKQQGFYADATKVLIAKEEDYSRNAKISRLQSLLHFCYGFLVGYGHKPWNALRTFIVIISFGILIFGLGLRSNLMMPVKNPVNQSIAATGKSTNMMYPTMNPVIYSLDLFIPIVDLRQANYWMPNDKKGNTIFGLGQLEFRTGSLLLAYFWFHILMGWIFTTVLVVAITGTAVRKR